MSKKVSEREQVSVSSKALEAAMRRRLTAAWRDLRRASDKRRDLPLSASRARRTTANARHHTMAEEWDRVRREAEDAGLGWLIEEVRGQ